MPCAKAFLRNGHEKMNSLFHEMFNKYELHMLRFYSVDYVRLSSSPKFKRVQSPLKEDLLNPECAVSEGKKNMLIINQPLSGPAIVFMECRLHWFSNQKSSNVFDDRNSRTEHNRPLIIINVFQMVFFSYNTKIHGNSLSVYCMNKE